MLLSNGADAVLADYSGSMMTAAPNHVHGEQYQGCPIGWYKVGHIRRKHVRLQPILRSSYFILIAGEIWDVSDYAQVFDPVSAVLKTRVKIGGVHCTIESFMADDHLLVEHYRVTKTPARRAVQIAFMISNAWSGMAATDLPQLPDLHVEPGKDKTLSLTYSLSGLSGIGRMFSDCEPDGVSDYPAGAKGIHFGGVKAGWSATKFLVLVDPSDGKDHEHQLKQTVADCRTHGYAGVKRRHTRIWRTYSRRSRVSLPDKAFQYLYDLSVYCLRAHQHQRTGAITVGMLPHLWGGGTYVPYDAFYAHHALVRTNHINEGQRHLDFYRMQHSRGQRLAAKHGIPGAVYSPWSNCFGQHKGADSDAHVLDYKPLMASFIVLEHYWHWKYEPTAKPTEKDIQQCKEILDLAIERFLDDQGDRAVSRPCIAGNESAITVENDTCMSLMYARALAGFAEMTKALGLRVDPCYGALAKKLYKGLKENYRNGVLLPFRDATYLATLQFSFYIFNLPEGTDKRSVYASLRDAATPFGLNTIQPEEGYRDWPWLSTRAAVALAHMGDSKECFKRLTHCMKYTSALGAIPEKIRIDGYPIGYGYPSPHALLVWASTTALCHDGKRRELRLLWGLDGQWKDLAFENIRLADGLLVSGKIEASTLIELKLRNTSNRDIARTLTINPIYRGPNGETFTIRAGKTRSFRLEPG